MRRGAVAAVVLVLAGLTGLAVATRNSSTNGSEPTKADLRALCEALATETVLPTQLPSAVVYVQPGISSEKAEDVARALQADDRVGHARYMGIEETYQEFRRVWAASPTMLENVRAGDLPNSFEVFLKDDVDSAAWVQSFQALHLDNIYDVRDAEMEPTVLDALVWPGHDPDARTDASTLASLLYDKKWPDKAAAVATAARAVGDKRLTEAVEALAVEVAERPQTPRVADSTVSVDVAAAAAVVEATAASRCRQVPLGVFTTNSTRDRTGN